MLVWVIPLGANVVKNGDFFAKRTKEMRLEMWLNMCILTFLFHLAFPVPTLLSLTSDLIVSLLLLTSIRTHDPTDARS